MEAARYLITGGAGFIGSNLAARLTREKANVRILDNLSTGRAANLETITPSPEFIQGDIRDEAVVRSAMEGIDYVLHQAAIPSVQRSVEDPQESLSVAVQGTLNILQAATASGVKRVVYAASSSAYGDSPQLPKVETMTPLPQSPYSVGKLAGENLCRAFTHCHGLETIALRYFNVFGPRQDPTSTYAAVIPNFITAYLHGKPPVIFGDGKQTRDFTYVGNVVEANLAACRLERTDGQVVNVACGVPVTLLELLDHLSEIFGRRIEPVFKLARTGDVRHSSADITQAKKLLGFEVYTDLKQGLAKTVDWYKKQP